MLDRFLFKSVDNSALVVFRVFFGVLIFLESWGAILTGWVRRVLVEPEFTFNFIGFDFLQYLQGPYMYVHFFIMGVFGIMVAVGYRYRLSIIGFTVFWTIAYLMQKSSYNNHYYLLILISLMMCFFPAHRYHSLDVKKGYVKESISMPNWVNVWVITQLFIVYSFASIAKLYPDWLDASVAKILMVSRSHYWIIGDILQKDWTHIVVAYFGIFFDLLIVPLLLWKKTRKAAFVFSIFFHLFNSIVFQIGIFPYMSLAFSVFFFPPEKIRHLFLRKKEKFQVLNSEIVMTSRHQLIKAFVVIWMIVQVALPLRHHFIKNDVLWTEEAHRMSWRMMLRSKASSVQFYIKGEDVDYKRKVDLNDYLTPKQQRSLSKPDVFWQFVQHLKKEYKNQDVEFYANARIKVNNQKSRYLVHPDQELSQLKWNYFKHNDWLYLKE
ncbi:MAG: HTTM domain-containing protein [Psychroflexus halocasei]